MGYILALGYAKQTLEFPSGYIDVIDFEVAKVHPFTGGSNVPTDPDLGKINRELDIAPYEYGVDIFAELTEFPTPRAVDNEGLVAASIDVTHNYSPRLAEVTDIHLSALHGHQAAESAPIFMKLIAELKDDPDFDDYWNPTDGNIKHLAKTLLDWTFQHPEGVFRSLG